MLAILGSCLAMATKSICIFVLPLRFQISFYRPAPPPLGFCLFMALVYRFSHVKNYILTLFFYLNSIKVAENRECNTVNLCKALN